MTLRQPTVCSPMMMKRGKTCNRATVNVYSERVVCYSLGLEGLGMADHHDAYNSMLQMNGLGLVHHLNGAPQPPPPVEMNGSVPQDVHRNGNTTPGQHQQNSGTLNPLPGPIILTLGT